MNSKSIYLSKSDFVLAMDCRTKLYYKKNHYPTVTSEYLELLRVGGYMVGKFAQLLYEGTEIEFDGNVDKAFQATMELLEANENAILYEATFFNDNLLARVDVLEKNGKNLKIIEVKSSSFDSDTLEPGSKPFMTKYKEKLLDVAFQYFVCRKLYPNALLSASLMMPDKNKTVTIDNLPTFFSIKKKDKSSFYEVEFTGDIKSVRESNFLTEIDVTDIVISMLPEIETSVNLFLSDLFTKNGISKYITPLNKACRDCEFRASKTDDRDGFIECWGDLAKVEPHVFDLYFMGSLGGTKEPLVNKLIAERKVSLYDVPESALQKERGKRQTIQIKNTRENKEWISKDLVEIMNGLKYPLYFIDFEFAETLRECIKSDGSILTWASYENTTLREIKDQIAKYSYDNPELSIWLTSLIKTKDNPNTRLVDMNDLTLKHYFHPLMKGKTSLKWVLPAVWQSDPKLHEYDFSKKYYKTENGKILDPYETLPKIEIAEQAEVVAEGTGAMIAYQEMLYGLSKNNPEIKESWKKLLLQYCELDTAAMVLVWKHWENIKNK